MPQTAAVARIAVMIAGLNQGFNCFDRRGVGLDGRFQCVAGCEEFGGSQQRQSKLILNPRIGRLQFRRSPASGYSSCTRMTFICPEIEIFSNFAFLQSID